MIDALRELQLLRLIMHENVIVLKDVMLPANKSFKDVYLVYELMDTDLHHIIKSLQPLSADHCKYFIFQLLRGLKYLHSANILHRDLKLGNLLINANCELKICDFGLARSNGQFMTGYVVTERLNYFYAATIMEHPLMSGAFSQRFLAENPYTPELSASTSLN